MRLANNRCGKCTQLCPPFGAPAFDSIRETLRALSTVSSIDEFWKGYEAKTSPLEQETGPEFHEAFCAAIHDGILPKTEPVGSDSIVQPGAKAG